MVVPSLPAGSEVATLNEVTKVYGDHIQFEALRSVSAVIKAGRMTLILGRSGSGKSSLLQCLAGFDTPTSGSVVVAGQTISAMKENQLAKFRRESVGFVFQSANLMPAMTVSDNIRLPLLIAKQAFDQGWFNQLIATLQLEQILTKLPGELTPLQQQQVACVRALIIRPSLMVADEPTGNLDTGSAGELMMQLRSCSEDRGQTIIVATHDPVIAAYGDTALVLDDGVVTDQIDNPSLNQLVGVLNSTSGSRSGS